MPTLYDRDRRLLDRAGPDQPAGHRLRRLGRAVRLRARACRSTRAHARRARPAAHRRDGDPVTGVGGDRPDGLPAWWEPLLTRVGVRRVPKTSPRCAHPPSGGRASAVLVLLGEQRARTSPTCWSCSAPPPCATTPASRPSRAARPTPTTPTRPATALREAKEEVGLDPASATVLALLPELWIPVSSFVVTPVLAWWHAPHPVHPCQPAEVAHVARLPVAELVDPANRLRVRHPSGWIGPAFQVRACWSGASPPG